MPPVPDHRRRQQYCREDDAGCQVARVELVVIDEELNNLEQHERHTGIGHQDTPDTPFFKLSKEFVHNHLL